MKTLSDEFCLCRVSRDDVAACYFRLGMLVREDGAAS